jgi:hypothetical protein
MIKWATDDDRTVEVEAYYHCGRVLLEGRIDGQNAGDDSITILGRPHGKWIARLGKIGLTQHQYDEVQDMMAPMRATIDAARVVHEEYVRSIPPRNHSAVLAAAKKAVATFVAAHPEVLNRIKED